MAFTMVVLAQTAHVLAIRSEAESLFTSGLWSNLYLVGAVSLTDGLQVVVLFRPTAPIVFATIALPAVDLVVSAAAASVVFWAVEAGKLAIRRRGPRSCPALLPT